MSYCFSSRLLIAIFVFLNAQSLKIQAADFSNFANPKTIIFIPGVLGSKLVQDGKTIWGDLGDSRGDFQFSQGKLADASPLSSMQFRKFSFRKAAYGGFFDEQMQDLSLSTPILPFSYDWRASNLVSARKFDEFFCDEVVNLNQPIIIVAHSMGGLVLKHWLKNYYSERCGEKGDQNISIEAIFFVATPHFGAPKSVSALLNRTSLIDWPIPFLDRYISAPLNANGVTFDSTFEIFPFSHAYEWDGNKRTPCFGSFNSDFSRIDPLRFRVFREKDGRREPVDIFSSNVLQRLGVLEKVEKLGIKNASQYLQDKLDRARKVTCSLKDFSIPKDLEENVFYLAGRVTDKNNERALFETVSDVIVSEFRPSNKKTLEIRTKTNLSENIWFLFTEQFHGDGTVPLDIATQGRIPVATVKRIDASHLNILNAIGFKEAVREAKFASLDPNSPFGVPMSPMGNTNPWIDLSIGLGLKTSSKNNSNVYPLSAPSDFILADLFSENGIHLDAVSKIDHKQLLPQNVTNLLGSASFQAALSGEFSSADDLYDFSKKSGVAADWEFTAYTAGLKPERRLWAYNNAGHRYFADGDFQQSAYVFQKGKEELDSFLSADVYLSPTIQAKLINNLGWAAYNLGSYNRASSYFEEVLAIEGVSKKNAKDGLKLLGAFTKESYDYSASDFVGLD